MNTVFISHASGDAALVEAMLVPILRGHGLKPWFAPTEIDSAADWEGTIERALQESHFLLAVLSRNSLASKWVKAEISWWVEERFSADYPLIPLVVDRCDWRSMHLVLRTIQAIDWARQKDQAARIKALKKAFRGLWCPRLAPKTCTEVCSLPSSVISIDSTSATRPWQVVYRAVCAEGIWTPDHGLLPVKDLLGENHTADLITSVPSGSNSNYTGPILLDSGLLADSSSHKLDRPLPTSILPPHATTSTCLQNGQIAAGYADGSVYAIDEVGQSRCLLKPGGEPIIGMAASPNTRFLAVSRDGHVRTWRTADFSEIKNIHLADSVTAFAPDSDRKEGIILGFQTGFIQILDWDLTTLQRIYHSPAPVHRLYVLPSLGLAAVSGGCLKEWCRYEGHPLQYSWASNCLSPKRLTFLTVTYEDRTGFIGEGRRGPSRFVATGDRLGNVRVRLIS